MVSHEVMQIRESSNGRLLSVESLEDGIQLSLEGMRFGRFGRSPCRTSFRRRRRCRCRDPFLGSLLLHWGVLLLQLSTHGMEVLDEDGIAREIVHEGQQFVTPQLDQLTHDSPDTAEGELGMTRGLGIIEPATGLEKRVDIPEEESEVETLH